MSQYGEHLHLTIFGQSHAPAIGMTLEGLPAGEAIDMEALQGFLNRRAPGQNEWSDPPKRGGCTGISLRPRGERHLRHASDRHHPQHQHPLRGLRGAFRGPPSRPCRLHRGGQIRRPRRTLPAAAHFSGRLTAPLCIAGGICLQLLRRRGITVISAYRRHRRRDGHRPARPPPRQKSPSPWWRTPPGEAMRAAIAAAKAEGDSVGGIIECAVLGLPVGLGGPLFDGMEGNTSASIVFGIPAVKGIEFGAGFAAAALRGSENNDAFTVENGYGENRYKPLRRHSGRHYQRNAPRRSGQRSSPRPLSQRSSKA